MKLVYIIGCGMGGDTITAEALSALNEAQLLIGAPRLTSQFKKPGQEVYSAYRKNEVDAIISRSEKSVFAVLVSGDTGFYSAAASYHDCDEYWVRYVAGVSSVSYFFGKCRLSWERAKLISAHGCECGVVDAVRRNRLTFVLTGGNVSEIAEQLCACGFGSLKVYVGEALGAADEKVYIISIRKLVTHRCSPLTVLIIENPNYDDRMRVGISDGEFLRAEGLPMTKSVVRAAIMSALALRINDTCWDIGCGTGSVTVEMALAAYEGRVFSLDMSVAAVQQSSANCHAFHIGNAYITKGIAPDALESFPAPDRVFIGGSSGWTEEIVRAALEKNAKAKIVISAVSPQSAAAAIDALENAGLSAEVLQVSASHGKKCGGMHMMLADNSVYIISSGGANE